MDLLDEIELDQTLDSIVVKESVITYIELFELFGTDTLAPFLIKQNA